MLKFISISLHKLQKYLEIYLQITQKKASSQNLLRNPPETKKTIEAPTIQITLPLNEFIAAIPNEKFILSLLKSHFPPTFTHTKKIVAIKYLD